MLKIVAASFLCILVATTTTVRAKEKVVLLGGGYQLEGSQAQIELNLKWVQSILEKRDKDVSVFYTDGNKETPDVFVQVPIDDSFDNLQPLARVFDQHNQNSTSYRNHSVMGVLSETNISVMEPELVTILNRSSADDSILFVYNGHGSPSASGAEKVALKLWGDTRLTAEQFHGLLSRPDFNADVRYIFTQCYSGGFHRIIYDEPDTGHKLADGQRCGFTAESSWRQSEGCSASIDMGDYRDYTTFFFAAINGKDRLGRPLLTNPDKNNDGTTDMREAHMYTLENAHSTDLSRSSSEDYLEQWRPWFLKWMPQEGPLPENEYTLLARAVAAKNELPKVDFVRLARQKIVDYREDYSSLISDKSNTRNKTEVVRQGLMAELTKRWPELRTPYTLAYRELLVNKINDVQNWIVAQKEFTVLRKLQDKEPVLEKKLLDLERNIAQLEKTIRLRKLAFLKGWLYEYGNDQEIKDYESLVSCESSSL